MRVDSKSIGECVVVIEGDAWIGLAAVVDFEEPGNGIVAGNPGGPMGFGMARQAVCVDPSMP